MPVTFSIVNIASAISWFPVDFNTIGNQFSIKKTPILFSNGAYFYVHNFLNSFEDFTFNRKTGNFLTGPLFNSAFLEIKDTPKNSSDLTEIESVITDNNGYVITYDYANKGNKLVNTSSNVYSNKDTLKFLFDNVNDKVYVQNYDKNYLSIDDNLGTQTNVPFYFGPKVDINSTTTTQAFNYILGTNSILLYNNTGYPSYNNSNKYYLYNSIFNFSDSFLTSSIWNFTSYKSLSSNNTVNDSFLVKYNVNPTINEGVLSVNKSFSNSNLLAQNYLGLFPVENPNYSNTDASYLLQIHGLKNYQTPEYKYSTGVSYITASPSIRRNYNKIFTGTNQYKGYDKVYLGYESNTKEYVFKVNQDTIFHYPPTSSRIALSSAGLIEDGAIAGELPFTSDRISIYRKNYQEILPGDSQPVSIPKYDNTWLCAWLSGTNLGNKVWVDRYYNAAYYTFDQALTAATIVYNEKTDPTKPFTYDVPSTMYFEPGVIYKYHRAGKSTSVDFLNYLNYDQYNVNGANVLDIIKWDTTPLIDNSNFNNDGVVYNPSNLNKDYITLDGSNHVVFPARSSLLQNSKLTVSLWLSVGNWSDIHGDQIFGNYYNSGFGLINDDALTAPLITVVNNASSVAYNINYRLNNLSEVPLISSKNIQYQIIQRLPDYNYWIFDRYNCTGLKINPINNVIGKLQSLSLYISAIDQVVLDKDQNIYFYDNNTKSYVVTDSSGIKISQVYFASNSGINGIDIDINNTVVPIYGNTSTIDGNNNIWEVVGGNLYKNRQIFANVGLTEQIVCDSNNNIWIAHQQDRISKLDTSSGLFVFSQRIGKTSSLQLSRYQITTLNRYINILKIPRENKKTCDKQSYYENRIVIVDTNDNEVYMLDDNGNLISKLNMKGLPSSLDVDYNFYAKGDFTGYQYLRKFGSNVNNFGWRLKISTPDGNDYKLLSLQYSVSALPPGWHNFSLTFDSLNGNARYYIDSIKVYESTFTPKNYQLYYDYKSSLLLGAASVRNTTLNEIIGIQDNYKFVGVVSDLKMYSKNLTQGEIEQIYFSSQFAYPRKDLLWNTQIGNRNFIEEIDSWYKMQLPGSKSKYFNINIHNLNINDDIKMVIEDAIKNNIKKIVPFESSLYKINWL